MSYIPTNWAAGDIVTAEKLNKIENGIVSGGLPSVTSTDNGDVLTVVEGAWAKATPTGGGGGVLVVHETNGALDKTWSEINEAVCTSGALINFKQDDTAEANSVVFGTIYLSGMGYALITFSPMGDGGIVQYVTNSEDGYPVQVTQ